MRNNLKFSTTRNRNSKAKGWMRKLLFVAHQSFIQLPTVYILVFFGQTDVFWEEESM
ncbi:hypothetical protein LPO01_16850 [Ligilactobacillus pobuzihii]|nr:hypothetical protein LPO01_16850 [Ligilactobacillus pobuzihii]